MRVRDIKELREMTPFKPFALHLTSGRTPPVATPDHLLFSPREDLVVLFPPDGGVCVVAPDQVARVDLQAAH